MNIRAVVLGASGYVGGELLRIICQHPRLELAAAVSDSFAGRPVTDTFPNLAACCEGVRFVASDDWFRTLPDRSDIALFSAAPHGASATSIAAALQTGADKQCKLHVVDASADFRFRRADEFSAIYRMQHPEPGLLAQFSCALPEHADTASTPHVAHPGCFATAATLAAVPLVQSGLVGDDLYLTGITGSTGSGRNPKSGTHHPDRHANLYAYQALQHRHAPEIGMLIGDACGANPSIHFVPHSGPFARGIHLTLQAPLRKAVPTAEVVAVFRHCYAAKPFLQVTDEAPRLKDVVASNRCHIGIATDARSVTVSCVIDNLVKGAAGGAMQWMNRLWSLPETEGLLAPAPAWM